MNNMKCYHYCLNYLKFTNTYFVGLYYTKETICCNTDYETFYNYVKERHNLETGFVVISLTLLNP